MEKFLNKNNPEKLISMVNIYKTFDNFEVLKGIDFDIGYNEIIGLCGDNGAGKSTLIKILTGVYQPTSGEIYYKGKFIKMSSVKRSRDLGIETVYQERALADQQSLWMNMFAGREIINRFGFIDIREQKKQTKKMLRTHIGFTSKAITMESKVKKLSGGEKQGVAIGRALYFDADLIILDEPTMGLSLHETKQVINFVRDIKRKGKSAIFISHNIFILYPISDRFVILDRGKVAGDFLKKDISQKKLVEHMVCLAKTGRIDSFKRGKD